MRRSQAQTDAWPQPPFPSLPRADPSTPTFLCRSFSLRTQHLRQLTNHSLSDCPPPSLLFTTDNLDAHIDDNSVQRHLPPTNQTKAEIGEMPTSSPPTATPARSPGWAESFKKRSAHEGSGYLGGRLFAISQVIFRTVTLLFGIATLVFVTLTYVKWEGDITVRVDIVWPCFFPVSFSSFLGFSLGLARVDGRGQAMMEVCWQSDGSLLAK